MQLISGSLSFCKCSIVSPVHIYILILGNVLRTCATILFTNDLFSKHRGSPPRTEKFRYIPFAVIASSIISRKPGGNSLPPLKSHVCGL